MVPGGCRVACEVPYDQIQDTKSSGLLGLLVTLDWVLGANRLQVVQVVFVGPDREQMKTCSWLG